MANIAFLSSCCIGIYFQTINLCELVNLFDHFVYVCVCVRICEVKECARHITLSFVCDAFGFFFLIQLRRTPLVEYIISVDAMLC